MALDPSINKTGNTVPSDRAADIQDDSLVFDTMVNDTSGQTVLDRKGVERETYQSIVNRINNDANEVIDQYRATYIGDYALPNKTFTAKGQFVSWAVSDGGDGNEYIYIGPQSGLPYITDVATYPNPNDDPSLKLNPRTTTLFVQTESNAGDSQQAGGNIWPLSSQESAQVGDDLTGYDFVRLQGGNFSVITLFRPINQDGTETVLSGDLNSFDLSTIPYSADIGGTSVYLTIENYQINDVRSWGAIGNSRYRNTMTGQWFQDSGQSIASSDDTAAIQTCVTYQALSAQVGSSAGRDVFIDPSLRCQINDTIREPTSGGAISMYSNNVFETQLLAGPSLNNSPMVWFGNSSGQGEYRATVRNMGMFAGGQASGNIGLRLHEAGTSHVNSLRVTDADRAIDGLGIIGCVFDGLNFINSCNEGLVMTKLPTGTPSGPDDTTVTAAPLGLRTNVNKVSGFWCTGVNDKVVVVEGGLCEISTIILQNCGNSATSELIVLNSANEAAGYGGGPEVTNVWCEVGTYRAAIVSRGTRAPRIKKNFISGNDSGGSAQKEAGILLISSPNATVEENTCRGFFDAPKTEGRAGGTDSTGIYIDEDSKDFYSIDKNYLTKNTCSLYMEGQQGPTLNKSGRVFSFAYVDLSNPASPVITNGFNVDSVVAYATNRYQINYGYNRETTDCGVLITPTFNSPVIWSRDSAAASNDRVTFRDPVTGTALAPDGFYIESKGSGATLT